MTHSNINAPWTLKETVSSFFVTDSKANVILQIYRNFPSYSQDAAEAASLNAEAKAKAKLAAAAPELLDALSETLKVITILTPDDLPVKCQDDFVRWVSLLQRTSSQEVTP